MPAPRKPRRKKGQEPVAPGLVEQWPDLKAQQRLQALLDPSELADAQQRCRTLLQGGYGPLEEWLLSDPTPTERKGMRSAQQGQQKLAF